MGDRYTITERVDQGGMAEVFRGVAESIQGFKKSVAIKRILPSLTKNKKFVSMFLDEARLSLHLQHANIVHVFDIGIADTAYFIVMEYVDGANLKSVIELQRKKGKRLPVAHSLYMMLEVCKGLAYAHDATDPMSGKQLGIVHRDISPPNILISRNGEVKLVDFGLAKATSQLETTDPGVVKGKFSYLSPEAASGQEVDHRTDIFAVGILLWELLTGRRLFYGETDYQTVELVRQAKVPSIRPLNPDVDPDLEAVVRKALARDPRDRFQHAADLQEAIAHVLFSRGLKVTSRDIAALVREVVAERERARRPQNSLIDALIQEEMLKFTSLDALGTSSNPSGAKPLSPEEVTSGQSPLDPGAFVDTRDWADDFSSEAAAGAGGAVAIAAPRALDAPDGRRTTPPPSTGTPGASNASSSTSVLNDDEILELDSLQEVLEPDRSTIERHVEPPRPASRRPTAAILIAVLVVGLVGGGLLVLGGRLFGGDDAPPAAEKK